MHLYCYTIVTSYYQLAYSVVVVLVYTLLVMRETIFLIG